MKRFLYSLLSALFLVSLSAAPSAFAQGIITGSISGTVVDSTGAVIPQAIVTAKDLAKGTSVTTKSQPNGEFAFQALPIGTYDITIESSGFSSIKVGAVNVTTGTDHSLGKETLTVGASTQVDVESLSTAQLETTQSQVTTSFDAQEITGLPTGGGFDELALLIPGVVNVHATNFSNTNGVGFSVNGERGRANNFELDGQSNNDNSIAGPQVFFSNDEALAEIQIVTDNFGAQYGRNAGSVVNYITKSGTNQFHGSAIYKYAGDFTSSHATGVSKGPQFGFCTPGENPTTTGCTPAVVPRFVSNWYGGTIGGPVIKNKLFFFGSTYFQRFTEFGALVSSGSSLFPTPAGLTQLAAAYPNSPAVAILQQLNPLSVPGGNPRETGPVVNETVAGVSSPVPFSQFGRQIPTLDTDQEDLGRLDWQPTQKDHIYVRYFYQKEPSTPYDSVAAGGFVDVRDAVHSVGADETHIFGPHWVNQLRYSFQQSTLAFDGGGFSACTITAFATCPSSISIGGTLSSGDSFTGLGLATNLPQGRIVKNGQVQDNATWTIGRHNIIFGGEFDYSNSPNTFLPNSSGGFSFDSFNDFLAGGCGGNACSVGLAIGNPVIPFKEDDVALYFQDDWKVTPSLTLNLGLRWEFFQQAINLLHNESVANQTGSSPLWSTSLPLSTTTLPAVPNYYKNYEPRIGFAYNPDFNKNLVIRGGYAINVDPAFYNINLNVASNAPLVSSGTVFCTGGANPCLPTGGATFTTVQQQTAKLLPRGGSPGDLTEDFVGSNFRNPIGQTFSLGIQYQVGKLGVVEARYVGNHTSKQFQDVNANPYLLDVATDFPSVVNPNSLCSAKTSTLPDGADIGRLHCGSSIVNTVQNSAFSIYNSLQTKLTTRSFHGVSSTVSYTFSKNIDNVSEIFSTGGGGNTLAFAQNPLNTDLGERGNSGLDFPNTASLSMIYQFPKLSTGHDLVNKLVNGWQANTVWFYNSGQPYNDYEGIFSASNAANFGTATLPGDPRTYESYGDSAFNGSQIGATVARPILSNPKASPKTLGIYTDTTLSANAAGVGTFSAPVLVDYASGAPVTPSQVRFIANNVLGAQVLGNPYPGSGRNILRGDTTNNVDFSMFKNTKINERVTFRLEVDAYNVLNRSYYGTPDSYQGAYDGGYFNSYLFNGASGSNIGTGTGVRNMEFAGKILF